MGNIDICIIDDDKIYQTVLNKYLGKTKLFTQITNLYCPNNALEHFKRLTDTNTKFPNIIFVDINMPFLDGWDVIRQLKNFHENLEHTDIYVISSSTLSQDITRASLHPMVTGFVSKPINLTQIHKIAYAYTQNQYS